MQIDPEELLTTTRSVRRRLDLTRPVPPELIRECIEVAVQAPSGGNRQQWHWMIVTDPESRRLIGERYREAWYAYNAAGRPTYPPDDPRAAQGPRLTRSAQYLADHMGEVPAMVIPCIRGRVDDQTGAAVAALFGSIVPATWSFMLAARLRGLGTAYTTLHLHSEREVAEHLGIPYAEMTQAALLPVAYYTGETFRPARARATGLDRPLGTLVTGSAPGHAPTRSRHAPERSFRRRGQAPWPQHEYVRGRASSACRSTAATCWRCACFLTMTLRHIERRGTAIPRASGRSTWTARAWTPPARGTTDRRAPARRSRGSNWSGWRRRAEGDNGGAERGVEPRRKRDAAAPRSECHQSAGCRRGHGDPDPLVRARELLAKHVLQVGDIRLSGTMPSGHEGILMPERMYLIDRSTCVLDGMDLGQPSDSRPCPHWRCHPSPACAWLHTLPHAIS